MKLEKRIEKKTITKVIIVGALVAAGTCEAAIKNIRELQATPVVAIKNSATQTGASWRGIEW